MLSPPFIIKENSMTHALRHLPAALTALLAVAALIVGRLVRRVNEPHPTGQGVRHAITPAV